MSSPRVRADYDSLAAIARLFGQEAANARQTLRHLRRQMDVLQSGDWIGRGATAFYHEMNGAVLPSLQRLVIALETAERVAAKISQIMRAAEEEASTIIRQGMEGGGEAAMPGGTPASSGAEDDDIFADVYAALDRQRAGDVDDEDIFAGVNIGAPAGGDSGAGGADAGPAAGPASPDTPSGGGSGDRRRGQGGVGGVGGASLGGGGGPEKNPSARRGSSDDKPGE
jgi:WXG100 family type VII secretion target